MFANSFGTHSEEVLSCTGLVWQTPEGRRVIDGLDFALGPEKTALVGPNGVGKSTLARLLVGELEPSAGRILRRGTVGWLPQGIELGDRGSGHSESVAEVLGIAAVLDALAAIEGGATDEAFFERVADAWDIEEKALAMLHRLGLPNVALGTPAHRLSGGEAMRVGLAGCLLAEPDLLVLDEPTNHLDTAARLALYAVLDSHRGGLLVISHDRQLLRRMERTLELSSLGLGSYGGGFDFYRQQVRLERAAAERRVEVAEADLARAQREKQKAKERQEKRSASGKKAGLRRGASKLEMQAARRSAEKTAGRLGNLHEGQVEQASQALRQARLQLREEISVRLDLGASTVPARKIVLEAEGVNHCWAAVGKSCPESGSRTWLWPEPGLDLRLVGPDRLALEGPSGCGKSTFARLLLGELTPVRGRIRRADLPTAWLDQRCRLLADGVPLLDGLRRGDRTIEAREVYWSLDRFGLGRAAASRTPETLSGGERMRAALASLFGVGKPPRLLVLDEPTNNLDLETVELLEEALGAYRGALILISHDADFVEAVGVDRRHALPVAERASSAQ